MEKLIRKGNVEQFNFSFRFGWGFFSAAFLFYKKIFHISNEFRKITYLPI